MNSLFEYPYCSICGKMLEPVEHASNRLNGFYDQDTRQIVHTKNSCKEQHYERKQKRMNPANIASNEAPVMIIHYSI